MLLIPREPIAGHPYLFHARIKLDEAVQDGRLTREQADELLDDLVEHFGEFPGGRGLHHGPGGGPGFHFGFGFGPGGEVVDAVARALGLSRDELFDRLATLENAPRDPEAERVIADGLRSAPHAPYALVQTALVQDEALKRADAYDRTVVIDQIERLLTSLIERNPR